MANVVRISKSGVNALTETDIYDYVLYSDSDNVLIKEHSRGSGSVAEFATASINHNLGYLPFYLVYTEISSGRYRIANSFDPVGSGWRVYTSTSTLSINNRYSSTFTDYRYYIFYDDMN